MGLEYFIPTKIVMGKESVKTNSQLFGNYGKHALLVTGRASSKRNGSLADVQHALEREGITYTVFDEIEENPSLETIEKAAKVGLTSKAQFVIGIGGGSPLDAAKAIAVMIMHPHLKADTLIANELLNAVPVLAVPTTAGTGSEVTPFAIVTDHKEKTKKNIGHKIFPEVAFLDAKYMEEMPYSVTIHTAVDALSHLVESYLCVKSNVISESFVEKGLMLWGECIGALLNNALTYETREKLLLASTLGGMAISQTGTSLPHGMGYPLTYYKAIPHGLANGILYKAYLGCFKDKTKVEKIHKLLGLKNHEALEEVLGQLCNVDVEITDAEIDHYAKTMCGNAAKLINHPETVGYGEIFEIYRKSL